MSFRLTVRDLGSGVARLSVADAPANATCYAAKWSGGARPDVWQELGTITAPAGDLDFNLGYGFHLFHAVAGVSITPVVSQAIVTPEIDVLDQCELGVAAQIRRLNLDRIGDRVYTQLIPIDIIAEYPCVFVVGNEETETFDQDGMNNTEQIAYPVRVLICCRDDIQAPDTRRWLWRQRGRVRRCFSMQRLPDVPKCCYTRVEPKVRVQTFVFPSNMGGQSYHSVATIMTVRCSCREVRGFNQM